MEHKQGTGSGQKRTSSQYAVKSFDADLLAKTRSAWEEQIIGDANSPYSLILDEVQQSLQAGSSGSRNRLVFFAIMKDDLVVGISELVFSGSANRCRIVKQLDTYLCPVLHDKLVFDESDEALEETVRVYLVSLLHVFALKETVHPDVLKLYAREPIQLRLFQKIEEKIKSGELFENLIHGDLSVRITGRWLNIEGSMGGENVQ